MPLARATPGSLTLGCLWRTKPCVSLSQFLFWVLIKFFGEFFLSDTFRCWWDYFLMKLCFLVELFFGRCLRPGLLRARLRSVAFGEPSPTYPYRNFCFGCLLSFLVELFLAMSLEKKIIFSMFWAMLSENKDNAFIQKTNT